MVTDLMGSLHCTYGQRRNFIFNYPISLYLISKFSVVSAVYDQYTAREGSYSKVQ